MRRPLGLVLVGLGSFLLALAPLVRFYVAENVVVAPLNYYQTTTLEAQNASYYDLATQRVRAGVTLAVANTVRGDTRANKGNKNIAVWDSISEIYDKDRRKQVEFQSYRIAFDRRTSQLVNCCGTHVSGDGSIRTVGYGLLFPLANVERRDYAVFDMSTRRPLPMRFDGIDQVQGLRAYRFVQDVPKFRTAKVDYKVSGKQLGIGKKNDQFKVDRYFTATNSVWVDPRTGIPVKHRQKIRSTVETASGKGVMAVADADLVTVPKDQRRNVARADDYAFKIALVKSRLPVGALIGGLVFLLAGAGITLFGGGARGVRPPRDPDGRFSGGGGHAAQRPPPPPPGPGRPGPGPMPGPPPGHAPPNPGPAQNRPLVPGLPGPAAGARHARRP